MQQKNTSCDENDCQKKIDPKLNNGLKNYFSNEVKNKLLLRL